MTATPTIDEIQSYLANTGWLNLGSFRQVATIWRRSIKGDTQELLIPSPNAADFNQRYNEVLEKIRLVDKKTVEELTAEILIQSHDFLSIRVAHSDVTDGTIPIEDGIELAKSARDILASAGRSALKKQRSFRGHLPVQVEKFIGQTRLGQTSRGSFVVNVFCKVGSPIDDADSEFRSFIPGVLKTSLSSISSLVEGDILSHSLEDAVSQGASANMCDAIVKLFGQKQQRDVTINFRPSSKDRIVPFEPFSLSFNSESSEKLQLASQYLRESYVLKDFEISGYVKRLDREFNDQEGAVWIHAVLPTGQDKNIKVYLASEDYQKAIQAHRAKQLVRCSGDVVVRPRSAILQNQRNFTAVVQEKLISP